MKQNYGGQKTLTVRWEGNERITYLNDGEVIPFIEAQKRARYEKYSEIFMDWTGVIPVNVYLEMRSRLSFLERASCEE